MYENPFAEMEEERGTDDESMDVATDPTQYEVETAIATATEAGAKKRKPRVDTGDNYVLHFYDLAARKPHSLYQFVKA